MDIVTPEIEAYAEAHTTPVAARLQAVADDTLSAFADRSGMMVGNLEGRFLEMLVHAVQPQHVLEIGTFTGYSALSMAAALPPGARITTCDISEEHVAVARRHIEASPHADRITIEVGPALDTIGRLPGPFDLVFIDADKAAYADYFDAVLPKLSDRGLVALDNTLWSGRVLGAPNHDSPDADTAALRALNERLATDPSLVAVQLTIRDGVTLVRKAPTAAS